MAYDTLTVDDLRRIAESILDRLEEYEGDEEIVTSCNTYGLGASILETRAGFINYNNIRIEGEEDEEEDW